MRKSVLSLGFLASANALPTLAHEMPAVMTHTPVFYSHPASNSHTYRPAHANTTMSIQSRAVAGLLTGLANGAAIAPMQSLNLDLSSKSASMTAASILRSATVSIDVGGVNLNVTAKTRLTPAEYMAVLQVASGQQQSLQLDGQGVASGGSLVINQQLNKQIANLVIPEGVTVVDLSRSGSINLSGNVVDDGHLYLSSTNSSLNTISLEANKITVQAQGLISDSLPAGSLLAVSNADSNLNLNLSTGQNFANAGTISSAGNLNITAGGSIINAPVSGQGATTPLIQATNNLNLVSGSGTITNTGLVSSSHGDINVGAQSSSTNLAINSTGGTFQAPSGNINIRQSGYDGSANINLNGGNYFSQNFNLNSGSGSVTGDVGQITGQLNTSAQVAHIDANTAVLTLGNQNISGDPTYANTGNIDIAGAVNITGGANLAIVAGGNIQSTSSSAAIIDNGGNVVLIAGANITSGGGTGGASLSGSNPTGTATGSVTVNLSGGSGGNIDFAGKAGGTASTAATVIDTSSSTGAGGNLTLVALADGATGGGVYLNNASGTGGINTSGGSAFASGTVAIYAGATSGTAIQTNNIITGGAAANKGGEVLLSATQATTSDGGNLVFSVSGTITSLNTIGPGSTLNNANITTGAINTSITSGQANNAGGIAITTLGGVTASGDFNTSGTTDSQNGEGGNGGSILISAGQGVNLGNLNTSGGAGFNTTSLFGGGIGGNAGAVAITTVAGDINANTINANGGNGGSSAFSGSNGGIAGIINVTAGTGNITLSGTATATGGNGGTGTITGGGSGADGGNIVFVSGGTITISGITAINTSGGSGAFNPSGASSGSAGSVTFIAGTSIQSPAIYAQGGSNSDLNVGNNGYGGAVTLTAGNGNIVTGNIATGSLGGNIIQPGTGGNVIIAALKGDVIVGTSGAAAISTTGSLQGGSVAISATGNISLVSVDGSNNVIDTNALGPSGVGASILLASAANGQAISLDGGNVNTIGLLSTGNAWMLSNTGSSHGIYTFNGSTTNANDFTTLSTQSITGNGGTTTISFVDGTAPTNFSPGGYSSINTSGTQSVVIRILGDTTLVVPIVSTSALGSGLFNITGNSALVGVTNEQFALFGNEGITINGLLTSLGSTVSLAALVDTSTNGISIKDAPNLTIGAGGSLGPVNLTVNSDNTLTITSALAASSVSLTATNLNFGASVPASIIASSGNVQAQGVGTVTISGSAYFAAGPGGSVSFLATGPGNSLDTSTSTNLTSLNQNTIFQSVSVNFGSDGNISAITPGANITFESPTGGDLTLSGNATLATTASGTVSLLAEGSAAQSLTLTDGTNLNVVGGGTVDIFSQNVVFAGLTSSPIISASNASLIVVSGDASAAVPLTITGSAGFGGTLSTSGGTIIVRPDGNLEFADSGASATTINLNAGSSGLVDIQAVGNVTLDNNVTVSTNSPIQVNLNANQTLTLSGNSVLQTTFAGNSSFPDPLGGTFQYSILVQNLITDLNLAGTGTIFQAGTTPGNTVFNDFIDVAFADGSNINVSSSNPGSYVNFFTRQIQVNGTGGDTSPIAALTANGNVTAINFNSNLPAPAPGDVAFVAGTFATTSATLNITGAPANVGFSGTIPPVSIPAAQQPVGNITVGAPAAPFTLTNNQSILMYSSGNTTVAAGSTVSSSASSVTIDASNNTTGNIIINGTVGAYDLLTLNSGNLGTVTVANGAQALGNYLNFTSSTIINNGTIQATNGTTIENGLGGVLLTGTGTWLAPTSFSVYAQGNLNVGQLLSANQPLATIALTLDASDGVLTIPVNTLTAEQNPSGNGGYIGLSAVNFALPSSTQPLTLNANATGTGSGGSVTVALSGAAPVTVGSGAGNLDISATGGATSGNGGAISVSAGGNLVVNTAEAVAGPNAGGAGGQGASYNFAAGTGPSGGTLIVKGNLNANAVGKSMSSYQGGAISLQSNSKTVFVIGSAKAINGTQGTISVNGAGTGSDGDVTIDSLGSGGILDTQPLAAVYVTNLFTGNGGTITGGNGPITISAALGGANTYVINLGANGTGKITEGAHDVIIAQVISANSGNGAITLPDISVPTNNTTTLSAQTGNKGVVAITNVGAGTLNVNIATGASVTIKSVNNLYTSGPVDAGSVTLATTATTGGLITVGSDITSTSGNVSITTAGNINVLNNGFIDGSKAVNLTASGTTSTITIDGELDTGSAGTVRVITAASTAPNAINGNSSADISANKSVTLSAPKSSVIVNTIGFNQAPSTVSITALTNIQNNGLTNALTSVTEKTTATSGLSEIAITGNVNVSGPGGVVTLTNSGAVGATSGITVGARINATKSVTILASKGDLTLDGVSAGTTLKATAFDQIVSNQSITATNGVALSTTSDTGVNKGSITVGSISTGSIGSNIAGGPISVVAAGGALTVEPLAVISANAGTGAKAIITLQNNDVTGTGGTIVIGASAQITTGGASGGNVNIVMGSVPASPKGNTLPTISGVTFNPNNPQSVIFVGAAQTNNGINFVTSGANNPIDVNVIGSGVKVIMNTGALAKTAITINGGTPGQPTTITADPPVSTSALPTLNILPGHSDVAGMQTVSASTYAGSEQQSVVSLAPAGQITNSTLSAGGPNLNDVSAVYTGTLQGSIANVNLAAAAASLNTLYGKATVSDENADDQNDYAPTSMRDEIDAILIGGTAASAGSSNTGKSRVLKRGSVVVAPAEDTIIETSLGKVRVKAQAVALIIAGKSGTAVYNLDDRHKDSVVIMLGEECLSLAPGRHGMITSHSKAAFEMINPAQSFAYRNLVRRQLKGDLQAYTAEFYMPGVLANVRQLRAMVSSDDKNIREQAGHLLKTVAIVSQFGVAGEYKQYSRPDVMASAVSR